MGSKVYELRVHQLDAIQLENDIADILKELVSKLLYPVAPQLLINYQPELDLLLKTVVWGLSIGRNGASFGQEMLFLKYQSPSRRKLVLHYLLNVGAKYVHELLSDRWSANDHVQRLVTFLNSCWNVLNVFNTFRFLRTGRMPTLVDYALGLNFVAAVENQKRDISFFYVTRELLWEGLIELVGITLPLINYHAMKRRVNGLISNTIALTLPCEIDDNPVSITTASTCAFCNERPTNPSHFGCGHIFCYYCVNANILADPEFRCPLCLRSPNNVSENNVVPC